MRQRSINKKKVALYSGSGLEESFASSIHDAERQVLLFFAMICQLLIVESLLHLLRQTVFNSLPDDMWWRAYSGSWLLWQLCTAIMLRGLRFSILTVLRQQSSNYQLSNEYLST